MINLEKLKTILTSYKQDFVSQHWDNERYKWEAVKHFQDHWDINASSFGEMFSKATEKVGNLLTSRNNFPRGMIQDFSAVDDEATRALFIHLFDETQDLVDRVEQFQDNAEALRIKHGKDEWKQHFQNPNSITTYLWLRYPDKYYIYKYSECHVVAKELGSDFVPKRGDHARNLLGSFQLYNELCEQLTNDQELIQLLQSVLTNDCYPDKALKTLTTDVAFYISRLYPQQPTRNNGWFPKDYDPNISTETWLSLLKDKTVFKANSLKIMKRMKDYGGAATCTQLSNKYGGSFNFYNSGSSHLARRVAEATGCQVMPRDSENFRWWPILYVGKYAGRQDDGIFIWKLRDELSAALDQHDLSHIPLYESETAEIDFIHEEGPVAQQERIEPYSKQQFLNEVYITGERFDTLVSLLDNKKNIILQGAPGVGKTFAAKRLAYAIMGAKDDHQIEFIQFHQNYSYEDFVMGYRPEGEGFELKYGTFYRFCQKAANEPDKPFFFIIDEINRGNLSKIFGELLMLIEKDYRGTKVTLAYNGRSFTVPKNLYLIGMMNTADRSLAMIDYALRRRFSFFEMEPGFNSDGFREYQAKLDYENFNVLVELVKILNTEIAADSSLGKGFCIGHSYFCGQENCTDRWLKEVVEFDLIPMLGEYWFDEPSKLQRWENRLRGVFDG